MCRAGERRGSRGVAAERYLLGWGRESIPITQVAVELEMTLQSCLRQEPEATSLNLHLVIIQGLNIQKTRAFIHWQEGGLVSARGILDSAYSQQRGTKVDQATHFSIPQNLNYKKQHV